jgi:hypothetical protein
MSGFPKIYRSGLFISLFSGFFISILRKQLTGSNPRLKRILIHFPFRESFLAGLPGLADRGRPAVKMSFTLTATI